MEAQALDARQCYQALRARDPRFDGRFYTAQHLWMSDSDDR